MVVRSVQMRISRVTSAVVVIEINWQIVIKIDVVRGNIVVIRRLIGFQLFQLVEIKIVMLN